jgi:replicative DNA helicase
MRIEHIIFGNLIENEDYARKVIPFLKEEYFTDTVDRKIFSIIHEYVGKYNNFPTKSAVEIVRISRLPNRSNKPQSLASMHQLIALREPILLSPFKTRASSR